MPTTQPTDIAAVLADPTRFAIYEKLASNRPKSFTVQEIAEEFSLHPNVARTHLSRLEEIGLVSSALEKSGRGGRPGKRYSASDEPVTLQFPRRDWMLLARLLVETLERLGPEALRAAESVAYQEGLREGQEWQVRQLSSGQQARSAAAAGAHVAGEANGHSPAGEWLKGIPVESLAGKLEDAAGASEVWRRQDGSLGLRFTTCPFRELAYAHVDSVCSIHRALLRGILEGIVGPVVLQQQSNQLLDGQASCDYVIAPAPAVARTA
ncbi:MAG: helix-turn-helix domain-containing protein [Limnochordaceae bacterium]|nr:helix-turn-helix domain-containing protein [Limnochordaceae bacterium]